jgi:hypothetical protein
LFFILIINFNGKRKVNPDCGCIMSSIYDNISGSQVCYDLQVTAEDNAHPNATGHALAVTELMNDLSL